jgi:hypothetical protein
MSPSEANMIKELLETRLDSLAKELGDTHTELHDRLIYIQEQTTLTNGRVKRLELQQERQKGFLAAVGLLTPVLTGVIVWALIERVLS